tara:strand:- start:5843 stop:6199 length:357 start_codon:yes stop_codon:yes gene_type:complete
MEEINVDFSNPFLYISVFSVLSTGVNLYYCCCLKKYKKSESEIQLTSVVCHDSQQDNMNKVIETADTKETTQETRIVQTNPIEVGEAMTQTEDSVFYDLMGKRWQEELEFYKRNNMKR